MTSRTARWCVLVSAAGCSTEFGFDPLEQGDPPALSLPVTEEFVQAALPSVDLLLVVDGTESMVQERQALADGLGDLVWVLDDAGVDWQIGVVGAGIEGAQAGWLVGSPYVVTSHDADVDALNDRLVNDVTGVGPEAGLGAAYLALSLTDQGDPNAGFRRSDAALHVVFVSDADDESDALLGLDPVAAFLAELVLQAENGRPAIASVLVGDVPDGCTSVRGTASAADRYHAVALAGGGITASICEADLAAVAGSFGGVSVVYPSAFPLKHTPVTGSARVSVDGLALSTGWMVTDVPSLLFDSPPVPGGTIEVRYLVEVAP